MNAEHTILTIENDQQRVGLLPQLGASAAYWDVKHQGEWQPLWRRYAPPVGDSRTVGNFPMVPFSNRITGGFTCDDVFYPMEPNRTVSPYPMHGNGWMHEWDVAEHSANAIELTVESHKMHGYPWEYAARQRYSIDGNVMTMRLEVTHLGEKRLPYGLGFHAFQWRGDNVDGPNLQFKADGYWISDDLCIPQAHSTDIPASINFNEKKPLDHGKMDNAFTGWDGYMLMERPDLNLRIEWTTTEPAGITECLLFRPDGPFFCFEPITHITNAINRPGMPGLRLLEKGQSMALEVKQVLSKMA